MLVSTLTAREAEVVRLLAKGLSAKQIAAELSIAPRTVEHHVDNARLKTNSRNRVHMIAQAIRQGLIVT